MFSIQKNAQLAETFTATSIEGDKFDLDELKGKVVFMNFWGTTCPICVSEIPNLNQLASKYRNKDAIFLAVSPESEANIKKFVKKKPFDFNLISNGFEIMARYADKSANGSFMLPTPMFIIINQKSEIELKLTGRDRINKLDETLTRLLKES